MRAHQIDLAGAAEEVRAAQPRHDAAGAIVDRDQGDLRPVGELAALLDDELVERALQFEAQRRGNDRAGRLAGEPRRQVRRVHGHGEPSVGHRPAGRLVEQHPVDDAVLQAAHQHPIAGRLRGLAGALRPAALGRLRNGDQQGGLGGGELPGFLAEIGEGGGTHALEVAAHRRQGQIDRQHLALGVAPFELQRARRLDRLGEKPARSRFEQAGGLHGNGRGARHDAAARDPLAGSARRGQRVDAPMVVEASVLVGLEQGEIDRIDVVDRGLEPPFAVGCREGAQQPAVGVDGLARPLVVAREVGREDPIERQGTRRQAGGGEGGDGEDAPEVHRSAVLLPWRDRDPAHAAAGIESRGAYMSETFTAGSTKLPGVTARTM